jgi:pSer/pThr/pTyr-binding forkhead associated (FHA) protein
VAKVIVRYQNQPLGEFLLNPGFNTIGRLPTHPISIENLGISRNHAFILGDTQGKVFILEDLKSLNGTYVNKRRVAKHWLRPSDVITIGQHHLEYVEGDHGSAAIPTGEPVSGEPWLEESSTGKKYPIKKDVIQFGNSSSDDIHIPGLMVGRNFASLNRKGTVWVINLLVKRFSQLRVNGEEIHSAKLSDGDSVEVAGTLFVFHVGG